MNITEEFTVTQPIASVWSLFRDVPELSRCLPGAEVTADNGDGSFDGRVSVKLGPIAASFDGTATVTFDDAAHTSHIKGRGVDRSGGSQGSVEVTVHLTETEHGRTDVTIDASVTLAGPIAQFGRTGLVNEVSRRLIEDFSACLQAKVDAGSPEELSTIEARDVGGISLILKSLWGVFVARWKRLFSRSER